MVGSVSGTTLPVDPATVATTTTTPAATTTVPPTSNLGVVWASGVDPARVNQPEGSIPTLDGGDGIVVRLQHALYIDPSLPGNLISTECAREIEFTGPVNGVLDNRCMWVQLAMDVPSGYAAGEAVALLIAEELVTPAGRQIDSIFLAFGFPGSTDVVLSVMFAGGEPGSTLRFSSGSNDLGFTELTFTLPPLEQFQPINFD